MTSIQVCISDHDGKSKEPCSAKEVEFLSQPSFPLSFPCLPASHEVNRSNDIGQIDQTIT